MTTVVGVRFREVGKIYYFDPGELTLNPGDNVIVDTARGTEFGTIMIGNRQVEDEEIVQPLKIVRRMATADDAERVRSNREKEKDAFNICREKIKERGLDMKLISAEYTFDNAKILFYFTADGRVDFRELVKDLAAIFKIRIELRQVGVRDETKLMGGLGGCGRPLCCASYLSDFVPVSIRMAKEQNLSLNPQKISGVCGRLMCCLKNEADTYEDLNTRLPKDGGKVVTADGREGIAESVNVLRERVRVLFTDEQGNREMEEFAASDLKFTPRRKNKTSEKEKAEETPAENYADEIDETVDELIKEAEEENDSELKALEIAEIDDVFEQETKESSDDTEKTAEVKKNRRRRHHHRKPSEEGEKKTNDPENRTENSGSASGKEEQSDNGEGSEKAEDDNNGHRPHRHRHHHPRHQGQQGQENNQGQDNKAQTNNRNQNREENQNRDGDHNRSGNQDVKPQEHSENGEKKHNGAYRRFRKRRPKNNTES